MALYLDGQKIISGGGGSGGHTIIDSEGVSLEQRTNLQFNGTYSEDNATDDTTEINVVREMTKAEFDELTEEEKIGLINVTDVTANADDKFQPVIYSTEEREIGVWTDGKPLYEKTYYSDSPITVSRNSWSGTGITITNVALIAFCSAVAVDGSYQSSLLAYINNNELKLQTPRSSDATVNYITLRYTKTTDQPGSGTWTPQGVPAVHYSTDEQIVGTWYDGSTLYERTKRVAANSSTAITLWTDSSVVVRNYEGAFIFRANGSTLTIWSRPTDNANRATVEGVGNDTTHGIYADVQLGTNRTNKLDLCLTVRYTKSST